MSAFKDWGLTGSAIPNYQNSQAYVSFPRENITELRDALHTQRCIVLSSPCGGSKRLSTSKATAPRSPGARTGVIPRAARGGGQGAHAQTLDGNDSRD